MPGQYRRRQCVICGRSFSCRQGLWRHKKSVHEKSNHKCDANILKDLLDLTEEQLEVVLQARYDIVQQGCEAKRQRIVETVQNLELSAPEEVQHSRLIDDSCVRQRLINSNKVYLERLRLGETISNILDEGVIREESLAKEDKQALELYRHEQLRLDINEIILTGNGL